MSGDGKIQEESCIVLAGEFSLVHQRDCRWGGCNDQISFEIRSCAKIRYEAMGGCCG